MEIKMAKYKKSLPLILLIPLLIATGIHATAQWEYNNGASALGMPNGVGAFADTGDPNYSMAGDVIPAQAMKEEAFTINFAGLYYGGTKPGMPPTNSDTFVISLYTLDGNGAPDTNAPVQTRTLSDVGRYLLGLGNSRTIYQFSSLLSVPLMLSAGTSYYLGISDTTDAYDDFAVAHTVAPGASYDGYSLGTDGFVSTGTALSFDLVAPEPSEWALIMFSAGGLIAAGVMRKRLFARK